MFKKYLTPFNILAIILFSIIVFLRFYKIGEWFSFNFDEEYQASLAWEQVKDFHPIWIGVSASNIGYYLGPGFTYLNAVLFWISKGDPLILAFFSAILGLATTISIFFVTKDLFNKNAALIASVIYGGSMLINYFDRRFWNPSPIPFIAVLMFYSLVKSFKDTRWLILATILMSASYHVHLSLLVFWPLLLLVILLQFKNIKWYTWALMIISYLIITSPLLIFDLNHNFDNLLAPLRFLQPKHADQPISSINLSTISTHFNVFLSLLGRLWFIRPYTDIQNEQCLGTHCMITPGNILLILFSVIIFFWTIWKSITNVSLRILTGLLTLNIISFILYPGYAAEYYMLSFLALFPVAIGVFLDTLPLTAATLVITLFLIGNTVGILTTTQEQYGLSSRKKLIQEVTKTVKDRPYILETYGRTTLKYHHYGGWRYLFKVYGTSPTQSFADEFFGWIYQNELTGSKPIYKVVITEQIEKKFSQPVIKKIHQDAFDAYILKTE